MRKKFAQSIIFLLLFSTNAFCATEEEMGQAAEQKGKLREAFTRYVAALQSLPEGSADDQRLCEKIIQIVQKLDPPPAVPEEAERYLIRGETAAEMAKDQTGFDKAAVELKNALRLAPWAAQGYFNLALVKEKSGHYEEAIHNLKLYLLAAPHAADAKEVQGQIVKLEYKMEQAAEERSQEEQRRAEEQQRLAEANALLNSLVGRWYEHSSAGESIGAPPNIIEIRIVNDRLLEMAYWSRPLQAWSEWKAYPYDPVTRTIAYMYGSIHVISSDLMRIEGLEKGQKCEWKRE